MFGDIVDVAHQVGSEGTFDYVHNTRVKLQACPVDIFVAGFVCTTVSGENKGRSASTIATGIGSTGVTWRASMKIISTLRP